MGKFEGVPACFEIENVVPGVVIARSGNDAHVNAAFGRFKNGPRVVLIRLAETRRVGLTHKRAVRRDVQSATGLDGEGRVRAPDEIDRGVTFVAERILHLEATAFERNVLFGTDRINGARSGETNNRLAVRRMRLPIDGTKLAEIGIRLALVCAAFTGGKCVIPTAAPIVIEVGFYRVALRWNARVVPEKILSGGLIDQIIDLSADFGEDGGREIAI